ncbi:DUF402 domain-containing protein [Arthrobacter sp. MYb213]|uniref:DUF402 domain-containing protein n=1 Tax=Arthrobacter sp. MYb213 TaxID=1848595 RepID=UPI00257008A8|nr:DUF402 domain-containing protein [Arthrobacter sp. MYb213]
MSAPMPFPTGLTRTPEPVRFGSLIVSRAWKYDGTPHWVVPGFYLGSDEHGHWLHQPAGSLVARPGTAHLALTDALCLIPHHGFWVATLYSDPADDFDVYIDLATSIGWHQLRRGGWEVNSVDMDLDVIRSRTRGTFLDDEDEFEEHSLKMNYPEELQRQMRETSASLIAKVAENLPPFTDSHRQIWLAKVAELPR